MNKLDNNDLERFAWEKMAPAIDQKIKQKKGVAFFKITALVTIPILAIVGFYHLSSNLPLELGYFKESNMQEEIGNEKQEATVTPLISKVLMSDEVKVNSNVPKREYRSIKSFELSQSKHDEVIREISVDDSATSILSYTTEYRLSEIRQSDQSSKFAIKQEDVALSLARNQETSFLQNLRIENVDKIDPLNSFIITKQQVDTLDDNLEIEIILLDSIRNIKGVKTTEVAGGINTLLRHPGNSLIGYEMDFGYRIYVDTSHYIGLGLNVQRLRFSTTHPTGFGPNAGEISLNHHEAYSVPFYYGYTFERRRLMTSIEGGFHFNFLRFSEGKISTIANAESFIEISDEEYFNRKFGLSAFVRARVEYLFSPDLTVFARTGYRVGLQNWYKDQSHTIKPFVINADLGISRRF